MIIGTIFSITPAFVYWLRRHLAANATRARRRRHIVAFTTLQSRLFFPLGQLLNVQVEIQGSLALFDRTSSTSRWTPRSSTRPMRSTMTRRRRGRVRFRYVSFRYPTGGGRRRGEARREPAPRDGGRAADGRGRRSGCRRSAGRGQPRAGDKTFGLTDIDFEAAPGQLVALVGRRVGQDHDDVPDPAAVRRRLRRRRDRRSRRPRDQPGVPRRGDRFVTQKTYLFHASIRSNLQYARPDATDAELEDIVFLGRRLGLYTDPSVNADGHIAHLLIGNEAIGQWVRRSALDNPGFQARMIGDFLDNFQHNNPAKQVSSGDGSPLQNFDRGKYLFGRDCIACHTIGHGDKVGPDLLGVIHVRSRQWLTQIIQHPDQLLEEKDPVATALLKKYNVRMPNIYASDVDTGYIIRYIEEQTTAQEKQASNGNATKDANQ